MIKVTKELASASNIDAPIFRFLEYDVRGQEGVIYRNCASEIDFVTNDGNLYVPVIDNVVASKATAAEDSQFMLLVSKGGQGIQGVQGKPGKDGKTPSVFARFDGKQMVFYTMEDIDGIPTTKRIAATNDLTGPAWKPKVINDTIVWEKSKDDETPQSIPLDELRAKEAPVLLRVNSDNTKREDETSGPANYIQWKYEGEDYWNNLISISELMNLTLAGVTIFPVKNEETGNVEYHLGHKEVTKATYDSTETGKRIITDVELGEVLFDAGKIPFPEYNYEYDIEFLRAENCDRKNEIKAIQLELPKFVKSVNEVRPDPETGNVQLDIPDAYTKQESDDKYQPKGDYQPAGNYAKSVNGITPDENGNIALNIPDTPSLDGYLKASDLKFDLTDYVLKYSVDGGSTWTTIGTTCACEHTPVVTTYSASIVDDTTLADHLYLRTTGSFSEVSSLSNLSNGTTVYGKATRSGYEDKTVSGTINGSDLVLRITGDWIEEETPEIELEVTPWSTTVAAEGDTKHYTVTTNASSYNIVPSCNFLTIKNKTTTGFDVEISENTSEEERTCTLTVTAEDKVKEVNLVQRGIETPELIDFEINDGQDITLNVGDCKTLYFTVNPEGYIPLNVDYNITSGDSYAELVYTNNGVEVCGTAPGNAVITLTVDGKSKTCNVYVNAVEPTYYKVTIGDTCGADTVYLTKTENGDAISSPYNAEGNETVWIHAEKSGKIDINKSAMIKDNYTFVIECNEWEDVPAVTYKATTINNSGEGTVYMGTSPDPKTRRTEITNLPDGTHVYMEAWREGYETIYDDKIIDGADIEFVINSSDWTEKEVECTVSSVIITPSEASLTVGETQTLSVSTDGTSACDNTVTWSSSDDSIATVDNGIVTAEGAGTATITATSNDDESVKGECVVTVNEGTPSIISVTGVSLPATESITRYCNGNDDRILLTAVITPSNATNQRVTWSVTNPGTVVSIDPQEGLSCVVEPAQMAGGNATVTVTTEDGNKTASCYITVQDSMIIDIASQEIYRLEKNDSYTLTTTTIPSDASITWNSEDPTCVSVDNGVITGLKLGSSNVTATNNVTGCMDNITITVYDNAEPVIRSLNATNISDTEFEVSMTLGINNGADQTYSVRPLIYAVTDNGNRDTSYLVGSQGDNDEQVDSINNSDFDYTVPYNDMGNREWIYVKAVMSDNPSNYDEDWVRMPAKEN